MVLDMQGTRMQQLETSKISSTVIEGKARNTRSSRPDTCIVWKTSSVNRLFTSTSSLILHNSPKDLNILIMIVRSSGKIMIVYRQSIQVRTGVFFIIFWYLSQISSSLQANVTWLSSSGCNWEMMINVVPLLKHKHNFHLRILLYLFCNIFFTFTLLHFLNFNLI